MVWQLSPIEGVERRMLDRIGGEVARATSIVRYAPGSQFSSHTHEGGEEFIVLDGVFQDEHGEYPPGSYIRNPPTTHHTPRSEKGCIIFVKLWQFDPNDRTQVTLNFNTMERILAADRSGVSISPLFENSRETVQIEQWQPDTHINVNLPDGAELLVLDGTLTERGDHLHKHSWLRLPCGSNLDATAGSEGAVLWTKYRHLRLNMGPP